MDGLRHILQLIESTGGEGTRTTDDDSALILMLMELKDGSGLTDGPVLAGGSGSKAAATLTGGAVLKDGAVKDFPGRGSDRRR